MTYSTELPSAYNPSQFLDSETLATLYQPSTRLGDGKPAPAAPVPWLQALFPRTYTRPLADFHEEFWKRMWAHTPGRPATEVYIWPRGFSKTTNAERAVVRLAAAGFRYILYVKETQEQADDAVQNIAAVLESPEIGTYYPLLGQKDLNKFGTSKGWRRSRLRTASGVVVDAAGLDTSIRGLLLEGNRPDVILLDDLDGKHDTLKTTARKIKTLTSDILPAGAPSRVVIALQNIINPHGIFTRLADLDPEHPADFLMDRVVSGPHPAVRGMEFELSGTNAEGRPVYRITAGVSSWPAARPLALLEAELNQMGPTQFIEEKQNEVGALSGNLYEGFDLDKTLRDAPDLSEFEDVAVVCDPAVTATDNSDSNGIRAGGRLPGGKVVGLYSWEGRDTTDGMMRRACLKAVELKASQVVIETNQGGDTWIAVYAQTWAALVTEGLILLNTPKPRLVQVKASVATGGKRERWQVALSARERGEFVEARGTHLSLFASLKRLPEYKPYDLADADAWLREVLSRKSAPDPDFSLDGFSGYA